METRLRYLAEVNPPTPGFDRLGPDDLVTFTPLETIWADSRLDLSRRRPKAEVATGYTRFLPGDILVPKVTPTFQAGRSAIASQLVNGIGAGTTELHVLRPSERVDRRFLRYVVRSEPFLSEGVSAFQGVAGLQRVPDQFVRDFPVWAPPLEEQRRIADFLDAETSRLSRLVAARRNQLALLQQRQYLTLDAQMTRLAGHHGTVPLRRRLRSIVQGWSPQADNSPAESPEWGVLKLSAIKGGVFHASENKALPADLVPPPMLAVRRGDVLMSRANTPNLVGDVAFVADAPPTHLMLSDLIYRLTPTSECDPEFLTAALRSRSARGLIESLARGSSQSMVKLRAEDIREIPVPAAPLPLQRATSAALRAAEHSYKSVRNAIAMSVELLLERKQGLITAAVTGQIDVTTARGVADRAL